MTKAIRAKELLASNPGISNKDFVQLLMTELGMSLQGARTYSYNARTKDVATKPAKASKAKAKAEKIIKRTATKQVVEKSVEDIAKIKEANLKRMKDVSKKLRPFRERLDEVIQDREPGFDPQLAREEVQGILEAEGFKDRPIRFED